MNFKEEDKQYLWHPFTQMKDWVKNDQLIIKRGSGVYLYDLEGNKYLDGVSSLWLNIHGHHQKEIDEAIKKQLSKIAHSTLLGLGNIPSIELAKKLVEIVPKGLTKVFFSDNGSTAVEIALKIAFQYWQQIGPVSGIRYPAAKTKFLTLVNAYHGDTLGSVSVGGIDLFRKIYKPLLFKSYKAPSPYCYRCLEKCEEPKISVTGSEPCIKKLKKIMEQYYLQIAAMIVEPMIQAAAGMIMMPKGYMKKVRELCAKYQILLICDEVAAGFGRTGKMFACEHEEIFPDILCLAKGLTGGYLPLAATLVTEKIYHAFLGAYQEKKTFFHGHSYTGNPLGCAAALANLEIFEKEKTLLRLRLNINYLKQKLKGFNNLSSVGNIRQLGFMVGIELVKNKETKEEYSYAERIGHQVILEARKRGAILRPLGNVIVLMPPLSISQKELEKLLAITYQSIQVVTQDNLK